MTKRVVRIEGPLAYVPLTQGREAIVDAADAAIVAGYNWHLSKKQGVGYAARRRRVGEKGGKTCMLHQVLMGVYSGKEVDHINGDSLDNRRVNLRWATRSENCCNAGRRTRNKSGFKGVSWDSKRRQWRAMIKRLKVSRHLGYFADPSVAHEAYVRACAELHGAFARVR